MESGHPLQAFRVGEWVVYPERNTLQRGADSTRVQPRLIQVLRQLALSPGRTVAREALLEAAWSRRMVNDEVLSRTIADLRQVLGDDARLPTYLETIPKLGYRLIAKVEWLSDTAHSAVPERAPAAGSGPAASAQPAPAPTHNKAVNGGRRAAALVMVLLSLAGLAYWLSRAPATSAWTARLLQAQPLTSEPGWELTPRLAHAADLLAYSAADADSQRATLRLRSRDGRVSRVLSDGSAFDVCPSFAPDDSEIVWTRHRQGTCQILRTPLLGGAISTVSDCAPGLLSCPDWVGEWLLYSAPPEATDRGAGLTRLRLRDGYREVLTSPRQAEGNDSHPRIAADGRIAYMRGVEGDQSLRIRSTQGDDRRVPFPASMLYGHAWMPDGRLLVASDGLGFRALTSIQPDTGAAELLGARGARFPDLAPSGELVYELASYDANVWWYSADNAAPRRLTSSVRYDAYPRLAPDGQRMLYQSNRDGPESLYLLDLRSGEELRLPLDPRMRWAQPAWSADGSRISLTRYAPSGIDAWQYVLGSDAATPLPAPIGAYDAQFDPDGQHAWCRIGAEGAAKLVRFALGSKTIDLSRPEVVEHYQIDKQGLFLVVTGDARLHHCLDPVASACAALPIRLARAHRRNWAIANDAVYFVAEAPADGNAVSRYTLSSAATQVLDWPEPGALSRAIDVDREQRFALIARTDRVDIDLMWLRAP